MRVIFLGVLLFAAALARAQVPAVKSSATVGPGKTQADAMAAQLKSTIVDAQSKMGDMPPWKKRIFAEEAVPQYQRFLRDYNSSQPTAAEVDLETLRNYLAFYAPQALGKDAPKALLFAKSEPSCKKCMDAEINVKGLLRARTERRGFVPVWATAEELGDLSTLSSKAIEERLVELSAAKGCVATGVIQWNPAPVDSIDGAHADEKTYVIRSFYHISDFGKSEASLPILENDAFETATARLLTEAFTEFGKKSLTAVAVSKGDLREPELEIKGVRDYEWYKRLRAQLAPRLAALAIVSERKLARGSVVFALATRASDDEIRAKMKGFSLEGAAGVPSEEVQWELK